LMARLATFQPSHSVSEFIETTSIELDIKERNRYTHKKSAVD
jgi:hypothetical protein